MHNSKAADTLNKHTNKNCKLGALPQHNTTCLPTAFNDRTKVLLIRKGQTFIN